MTGVETGRLTQDIFDVCVLNQAGLMLGLLAEDVWLDNDDAVPVKANSPLIF
jgi:hypothetical protein